MSGWRLEAGGGSWRQCFGRRGATGGGRQRCGGRRATGGWDQSARTRAAFRSGSGCVSAMSSSYAARPSRIMSKRPPRAIGSHDASATRMAAESVQGASGVRVLTHAASTDPRLKNSPLGRRASSGWRPVAATPSLYRTRTTDARAIPIPPAARNSLHRCGFGRRQLREGHPRVRRMSARRHLVVSAFRRTLEWPSGGPLPREPRRGTGRPSCQPA
jgi:hypothetical protein